MQLENTAENTPVAPNVGDRWYRYEDRLYASGLDEFEQPLGSATIQVTPVELAVVQTTPCGAWLVPVYMTWDKQPATQKPSPTAREKLSREKLKELDARFVLMSGRKRYAYPTKKEALESFVVRKARQAVILTAQLGYAKAAIVIAVEMQRKAASSPELQTTAA